MSMYGIYYKTPIRFKTLIEKQEPEKTSLENSIAQYINLVITSEFGSCKFNEVFGCGIWEADFDLLSDNNTLREKIRGDIKNALLLHETRLDVKEVAVTLSQAKAAAYNKGHRMKKRVDVVISGFVRKTNRFFEFRSYFFVGPLSYT